MYYKRYQSFKKMEQKKSLGITFADKSVDEIDDSTELFKFYLMENKIDEFPTFIQYDKFYLSLTFDLLTAVGVA